MEVIYLDYNASTPIDNEVAEFMIPFLKGNFGNPSSTHWYGVQTRNAIEEARKKIAAFIHCSPGEIIFTSGGTESNNLALRGIAYAQRSKGNHIITSSIEHPAVLEVCKDLENNGFEVTYLNVDAAGIVDPLDLKKNLRNETILVSIMHANNETGSIQPIKEISQILKNKNIIFHTDAAQSAGKIKVDIKELGIDLLSLAGHKFYGPKGVGALYVKQGIRLSKIMYGADHERNLRPGTENVLEIAGLGKAAEIASRDLKENADKMSSARDLLYEEIKKRYPSVVRNGDSVKVLPNTLNISFPGIDAGTLLSELTSIAASSGAACHADQVHVSHVLEAMKIPEEVAMGTLRLSTGKHTSEEEVMQAAQLITGAVLKLSGSESTELQSGNKEDIALTKFTHGLGCACKISPRVLDSILKEFPSPVHPDILVGTNTSDDAAVYRINDETALVQTVDFFTPVIDDPAQFGAIAASNALSDVYAMGAKPLFALNIVAFPVHRLPHHVLKDILAGAQEVAQEAGIYILGGHTIEDNEPKFGMVVSGTVHPQKLLRNSSALPGDDIIITKPIGTGILSTAMKRGFLSKQGREVLYQNMRRLNKYAADTISSFPVSACTDVTGFGLLGHLKEMAESAGIRARIFSESIPLLPETREFAERNVIPGGTENNLSWLKDYVQWGDTSDEVNKYILSDAQTSGGLLFSVPPSYTSKVIQQLKASGDIHSCRIGRFEKYEQGPVIEVS